MEWQSLIRQIDDVWLWLKIVAAKWTAAAFAVAAVIAFGVVAIELGVQGISWLKTGVWAESKTIGEAFPVTVQAVRELNWTGAQRTGLWVTAQSVLWGYAALGIVCFLVCGLFLEVGDRLQSRRRRRQPTQSHSRDEDFRQGTT